MPITEILEVEKLDNFALNNFSVALQIRKLQVKREKV